MYWTFEVLARRECTALLIMCEQECLVIKCIEQVWCVPDTSFCVFFIRLHVPVARFCCIDCCMRWTVLDAFYKQRAADEVNCIPGEDRF